MNLLPTLKKDNAKSISFSLFDNHMKIKNRKQSVNQSASYNISINTNNVKQLFLITYMNIKVKLNSLNHIDKYNFYYFDIFSCSKEEFFQLHHKYMGRPE